MPPITRGIVYLPSTVGDLTGVYTRPAHLAAHRAKVRHTISSDGAHNQGRSGGGLHPVTVAFMRQASRGGNACEALIRQTHQDAVDAVRLSISLDAWDKNQSTWSVIADSTRPP
jgi:hypothetical protein